MVPKRVPVPLRESGEAHKPLIVQEIYLETNGGRRAFSAPRCLPLPA